MFEKEDFELSMEKQLKKRVIFDDIDSCNDPAVLRESLKSVTEQLMKYQQLLDATLRKVLDIEVRKLQ